MPEFDPNQANAPGRVVVTGAQSGVKYAAVSATVTRCGCGDPDSHALLQLPCPDPRAVEDLGVIAEYRRPGPLRRVLHRLGGKPNA